MFTLIVATMCLGVISATPHSRIVNGTDAELGEFPYVISLRTSEKRHTCGGSIINSNFVLTAAHCVYGSLASSFSIQYGVVDISADDTNSIQVEKITIHEDYIPFFSHKNDIALLKLASPIPLSERVQPVNLPTQEENVEGWSLGTLIGWGLPYTGGSVMEHLQKVNIFIYPHQDCQSVHGGMVDEIHHLCAGVPEGGKGQCNGDSGGPLTFEGVQVGIVSWSMKPCTLAGPGVFCRVSHHINWIKEKMETV